MEEYNEKERLDQEVEELTKKIRKLMFEKSSDAEAYKSELKNLRDKLFRVKLDSALATKQNDVGVEEHVSKH
ncbi:MAG: hypothetical protein IJ093_03455 [Bacilli bacterium]|nr:hypothetical protein [Bacilli bacterium]